MPTIEITEEQHERLKTVRNEVEAAYIGPYGQVGMQDAIAYLLDTYTPPGDADPDHGETPPEPQYDGDGAEEGDTNGDGSDPEVEPEPEPEAEAEDDPSDATPEPAAEAADDGADGSTDDAPDPVSDDGGVLGASGLFSLLEEHADKWRERDGEEGRYEVDLPDGSTDTVRTKDDVRGLLFRHYQ